MKDRYQRFLDEILNKFQLDVYEAILNIIVEKIKIKGCKICTRSDGIVSSFSRNIINTECIIRISIKDEAKDKLEIIWDILHEFGHLMSGLRKENDTDHARELEAWHLAEIELVNHELLLKELEKFHLYKKRCLNTYQKNDLI